MVISECLTCRLRICRYFNLTIELGKVTNRESLKSKLRKHLYPNIHASNIDSLPIPTPLMENSIVLTLLDLGDKAISSKPFSTIEKCLIFRDIFPVWEFTTTHTHLLQHRVRDHARNRVL